MGVWPSTTKPWAATLRSEKTRSSACSPAIFAEKNASLTSRRAVFSTPRCSKARRPGIGAITRATTTGIATNRFRGAGHDRERDALQILYAFYGVQHRTVNVTDVLRAHVREGSLFLYVNNNMMGSDPAVGADKVLIVVYRFEGKEQAVAVGEGYNLTLP